MCYDLHVTFFILGPCNIVTSWCHKIKLYCCFFISVAISCNILLAKCFWFSGLVLTLGKRCKDFWRFACSKENTRQNLPSSSSSSSSLTKNASQILAARRRIVRTKGEEKTRRSGGEIECATVDRGERSLSLGDGSFQVHFSFVATAGIIVFFRMGEFAAWHLQNCVWYCYLQGTQCQRTPEFLDLGASFASARDRISWLLLVWPIRVVVAYAPGRPFRGPFFFLPGSMCCFASLRIWKCWCQNVSSMPESVKIVIRISISEQGLSLRWRGIGGVRMLRYP